MRRDVAEAFERINKTLERQQWEAKQDRQINASRFVDLREELNQMKVSAYPGEPMGWLAVIIDADGEPWFSYRQDRTIPWNKPWYSQELGESRNYSEIVLDHVVALGYDFERFNAGEL